MMRIRGLYWIVAACLLALGACRSAPGEGGTIDASIADVEQTGLEAADLEHKGPGVTLERAGTARFVPELLRSFDARAALELVTALDALWRTPGSADYERGLDLVARHLERGGFGTQEGLELEWLDASLDEPAWTGHSARITLRGVDGRERVLHSYEGSADRDRAMLPRGAPSASVEGRVRLELDEVEEGDILISESFLRRDLVKRAAQRGAVAVVGAGLGPYNVDPSGADRHLDAIQSHTVPQDIALPVGRISPRSLGHIRAELERGEARLVLETSSETGLAQARTLVARIRGSAGGEEAVVCVSHAEDPGAIDNASGAAGMAEGAVALARLVRDGRLERPARDLVFVFGPELAGTQTWLEATDLVPVAAINLVMIGSSPAKTGAICLLERHPDPGAEHTIYPDEHTLWGARPPDPDWLVPNAISIVARCALADVSLHAGGWPTAENPYEGGTDHEVLLGAGIPTVLFWHFTDFTFHTSLDRVDMVDAAELERTAVAGFATALAMADPKPTDLDRYLESLNSERRLRINAAREIGRPDVAQLWRTWFEGGRMWMRAHCLGIELPELEPLPPLANPWGQ